MTVGIRGFFWRVAIKCGKDVLGAVGQHVFLLKAA